MEAINLKNQITILEYSNFLKLLLLVNKNSIFKVKNVNNLKKMKHH
jgi:hypothetical protein